MKKPETPRHEVAHHEAGHAVISFVLKRGIRRVTLSPRPKSDALGKVTNTPLKKSSQELEEREQTGRPISPRTRRLTENNLMIILAGGTAVVLLTGRRNLKGNAQDEKDAKTLAHHLCGGDRQGIKLCLACFRYRTESMMEDRRIWYMIRTLAQELLVNTTILGPEVKKILNAVNERYSE